MADDLEKVEFRLTNTGETVEFYVIGQTCINCVNYLLVADSLEDEAQALILKEVAEDGDETEVAYELVEDVEELDAIAGVFEQLLEDEYEIES